MSWRRTNLLLWWVLLAATVAVQGQFRRVVISQGNSGGAVDVTAPTCAISAPSAGGSYDNGMTSPLTTLAGTASDDFAVTSVTWENVVGGSTIATGTATGTTSWSEASVALANGTNTITVTAHDAAGHVGTCIIHVTYRSGSGPKISSISGTPRKGETMTVVGTDLVNENTALYTSYWTDSAYGGGRTGENGTDGVGIDTVGMNCGSTCAGEEEGNTAAPYASWGDGFWDTGGPTLRGPTSIKFRPFTPGPLPHNVGIGGSYNALSTGASPGAGNGFWLRVYYALNRVCDMHGDCFPTHYSKIFCRGACGNYYLDWNGASSPRTPFNRFLATWGGTDHAVFALPSKATIAELTWYVIEIHWAQGPGGSYELWFDGRRRYSAVGTTTETGTNTIASIDFGSINSSSGMGGPGFDFRVWETALATSTTGRLYPLMEIFLCDANRHSTVADLERKCVVEHPYINANMSDTGVRFVYDDKGDDPGVRLRGKDRYIYIVDNRQHVSNAYQVR